MIQKIKNIFSQNIIEGYWDENEETKELMNIFHQAKIDNKLLITNIET